MNLDDRLKRLEAKVLPTDEPPMILRVVFGSGSHHRIRCGSQEWTRREVESTEAFWHRAESEVVPEPGQFAVLLSD